MTSNLNPHPGLSQQMLKDLLNYDPFTGEFTWKVRVAHCVHVGDPAGYRTKRGYVTIRINKKPYQAHRLAFLYMVGIWPAELIDHIDGDCSNNRWPNLRDASATENTRNAKRSITNKSGCTGVYWDIDKKSWCATIGVGGRMIRLGKFDCLSAAATARKAAERHHGFHQNHGRVI